MHIRRRERLLRAGVRFGKDDDLMKRAKRPIQFALTFSILLCLIQISPAQAALQGAGTEKNPFQISNEAELRMIADFNDAYWILTDDVVLTSQWTPVTTFTGTLDGNGYKISGLDIEDKENSWPNEAAFISVNTGTIKNLHLEGEVTYESSHLGGAVLVYENSGRIENCSVKGTANLITNADYAQNNSDFGGLVSCNTETGVIENCYTRLYAVLTIKSGGKSYGYYSACFVNRNQGQIKNCYSASRGQYLNEEFRGFSTRTNMYTGTYESCYYDKDLPGIYSEGYDTDESYHKYPRTTAAMKTQYNYTGWDFDQIWAIDESINDGYPYLRNEKSITIHATGLALDQTEATVQEGKTVTLLPVFTPQDTTDQTVTWTTSNRYVATVQDGVVTGVSEGTATITAKAVDGGFTAECVVTVTPEPVEPQYPSGSCGENLTWTLIDGKLTISGTGPMSYEGYEAPWIDYGDEITQIEICNGVTTLAEGAFSYTSAVEISIPQSVTEIGTDAMGSCTELERITVAAANPAYSARDGVLFNKAGTVFVQYPAAKPDAAYHVPDGVEKILYSAVYMNSMLKDLYIPDSVTEIEDYAISTFGTLTIHGTAGGVAQQYVEAHNQLSDIHLTFEATDGTGEPEYDYTVNSVSGRASSGGKFRAEVSVTKNTDAAQGVIILALYTREGALSDFIFMQGDFEQGKTYTFGGTLTGFEGAVLKAFVWDGFDTMIPISNTMSGGAG